LWFLIPFPKGINIKTITVVAKPIPDISTIFKVVVKCRDIVKTKAKQT